MNFIRKICFRVSFSRLFTLECLFLFRFPFRNLSCFNSSFSNSISICAGILFSFADNRFRILSLFRGFLFWNHLIIQRSMNQSSSSPQTFISKHCRHFLNPQIKICRSSLASIYQNFPVSLDPKLVYRNFSFFGISVRSCSFFKSPP